MTESYVSRVTFTIRTPHPKSDRSTRSMAVCGCDEVPRLYLLQKNWKSFMLCVNCLHTKNTFLRRNSLDWTVLRLRGKLMSFFFFYRLENLRSYDDAPTLALIWDTSFRWSIEHLSFTHTQWELWDLHNVRCVCGAFSCLIQLNFTEYPSMICCVKEPLHRLFFMLFFVVFRPCFEISSWSSTHCFCKI